MQRHEDICADLMAMVRETTDMARSFGKPFIQIRPQDRPYNGLTRLGEPITWRWKTINAKLDDIASRRR